MISRSDRLIFSHHLASDSSFFCRTWSIYLSFFGHSPFICPFCLAGSKYIKLFCPLNSQIFCPSVPRLIKAPKTISHPLPIKRRQLSSQKMTFPSFELLSAFQKTNALFKNAFHKIKTLSPFQAKLKRSRCKKHDYFPFQKKIALQNQGILPFRTKLKRSRLKNRTTPSEMALNSKNTLLLSCSPFKKSKLTSYLKNAKITLAFRRSLSPFSKIAPHF